jgi:hypothetical protein
MNKQTRIAFISAFITFSTPMLCHAETCAGSAATLAAIRFRLPLETLVTVDELGETIQEAAKIPVKINPDVFNGEFSSNTKIYLRDVRTLCEMVENFTQAAGLSWRISSSGAVELFRVPDKQSRSESVADLFVQHT